MLLIISHKINKGSLNIVSPVLIFILTYTSVKLVFCNLIKKRFKHLIHPSQHKNEGEKKEQNVVTTSFNWYLILSFKFYMSVQTVYFKENIDILSLSLFFRGRNKTLKQ